MVRVMTRSIVTGVVEVWPEVGSLAVWLVELPERTSCVAS